MEKERNTLKSPVSEREGKSRKVFGITLNDCPLWVIKGIAEPAKEKFNDIYWMRVADLLEKEKQLYILETAIQNGVIYNAPQEEAQELIVEDKEVVEDKPNYLGSGRRK